jgi:hypothetical protein
MTETRSHVHAFDTPYTVKKDNLRTEKQWTALGPEGRLGDFEILADAALAIETDSGLQPVMGASTTYPWGFSWDITLIKKV